MISIIHPSRSRPQKSFNTIKKWIDKAADKDNLEIIVNLDKDDPTKMEYWDLYEKLNHRYTIAILDNKSTVEAINSGAEVSQGDLLIVVSDDTDCPKHWDKILLDATGQETDFVMKVDDGIQRRTITMPIMDRVYYQRDGRIYDPDFRHSWADTYLTELAHKRGRVITRMDIKFQHDHYSINGEKPDALYQRNDKTHDDDRHIYNAKMRELSKSTI